MGISLYTVTQLFFSPNLPGDLDLNQKIVMKRAQQDGGYDGNK
jgi:hypothetical protein